MASAAGSLLARYPSMRPRLALSLLFALPLSRAAARPANIIDKEGRTIYSNVPVKNARKVVCFQPPRCSVRRRPSQAPAKARGAAGPTSGQEPQVEPATQRRRDDDRRADSRRGAGARAASAGRSQESARRAGSHPLRWGAQLSTVLERLKPYQEAVALHEKNVASIAPRLANLK